MTELERITEELTKFVGSINEEDIHDVIFQKEQEIKGLLKEKLSKAFEETKLGYLFGVFSTSDFQDALGLLRFFDDKFDIIHDYLQSNDPDAVPTEEKEEAIKFRDKQINKVLAEVDAKLQEIK